MKRIAALLPLTLMILSGCAEDIRDFTGSISGKVMDAVTEKYLSGASVSLTPGGRSVLTPADGTYSFGSLDPGSYTVSVSKNGYSQIVERVDVVTGQVTVKDVALQPVGTDNPGQGGGSSDNPSDNPSDDPGKDPAKDVTGGLYALYTFENATPNVLPDGAPDAQTPSGLSYVGSYDGTRAAKFSRSEGHCLKVADPMIHGKNSTVAFWIRDFGDGHVYSVNSSGQYPVSFILAVEGGKFVYIQSGYLFSYPDYGSFFSFGHGALNSGLWHHIAVATANDAISCNVSLYIDGSLAGSISEKNQTWNTVNYGISFNFGGRIEDSGLHRTMDGASMTVDNLRVYKDRALTAAEVRSVYEYEKR